MGRALILASVFLLAAYAAYFAGRAALADAMTIKARWTINQWRDGNRLPFDLAEWKASRESLMDALVYEPSNPLFYEDLAFLYSLRASAAKAVPELEHEFLKQVVIYYKQSVSLRPMSPHAWADIALAHHYLGDNNAEMWTAFDLAMAYGRNEPAAQLTLAEIGLSRWDELSEARRTAINAAFVRAAPSLRKRLEAAAKRHQHDYAQSGT